VKVTLKYPDYIPVMERCSVAATRAKLEAAFNSRCKDANTSILEELISVRHQKALLMGYPTHAAFVTEDRMSKTPEKVAAFLGDLGTKLKPLLQSDLRELEKLKQAEVGAGAEGDGADARIAAYDRSYYQKKLEEGKFSVDHEALKQYFPLEVVTDGLLSIYQELLGLVFTRDESVEKAAWHEDVVAYAVSDRQSEEAVGIFYMDLHPREGKYGHAACFGLQPACVDHRGKWQQPVAAAVCNFPKPTAEKPALLSHGDVETFFHEFGHVMHQICSKAAICMFAGTRVERDFVEAPSQCVSRPRPRPPFLHPPPSFLMQSPLLLLARRMLENWCWQPAALKRMSGHHKTRAPIPEELLDALLASRNANSGLLNMRQITLASFDQAIHTVDRADTAEVLAKLSDDLMTIPTTNGTNMGATFGHMGGGYDAQYYGYMWSDVYAMDMFASRFEKEGIFSPETGMSYRKEILSVGGSRDALDSLVAFLGREPIPEPFLVSKGLAA
jgi:thimet oligopeptidase